MRKSDTIKLLLTAGLILPNVALAYGTAPRGTTYNSSGVMFGQPYMGMSFSFANLDVAVDGNDRHQSFSVSNNSLAGALVGVRVTPNVAFEIRAYGNASQGHYQDQRVSVDYYYGAFTKFILPLTPFFETYALMGFGNQKLTVLDYSGSDTDMAYGLGTSFSLAAPAEIQLEWVQTYNHTFDDGDHQVKVDEKNIHLNLVFGF